MDDSSPTRRSRLGPRGVTLLGLVGNVLLGAGKIAVGTAFHSQAILADGLHSLTDLAGDLAVLAGLSLSGKPADREHHYGHRRAATLATLGIALLLMFAAAYVVFESISQLREPAETDLRAGLPLAMALASIVIKEALYHVTIRVGRRAGDHSVIANAWHHRSDAWSSLAAAVGLAAAAIGGPGWRFLDLVAAVGIGAVLMIAAFRIPRGAMGELMDAAPSRAMQERIEEAVAGTEGVRGFHGFRARRLGGEGGDGHSHPGRPRPDRSRRPRHRHRGPPPRRRLLSGGDYGDRPRRAGGSRPGTVALSLRPGTAALSAAVPRR
jgi:cation diffusion facilitator family transporter